MYTDLSGFSFPIISAPWVISPFNSKALAILSHQLLLL